MGWFNKVPEGTIPFSSKYYPLTYKGNELEELTKIMSAFTNYISNEVALYSKLQHVKPVDTFIYQLMIRDYKYIANYEAIEKFLRLLSNDSISMSYGRFLDTIQYIVMTVDPLYLSCLKGRYLLTTVGNYLSGDRIATPTEEDWKYAFDKIPWLYLLPLYAIAVFNNERLGTIDREPTPVINDPAKAMV